ncbi:MAG: 3'-5' exonuclease [Acholeplasmatales bacterium]|jgi:DNA polymerase III epsilon subunit family exonuclease|nr:3'-5' exonuclease [Acholeplasmatales bacterium]
MNNINKVEIINDYVVVDIETTGLSCKNSEIIEIGAVKVKNGAIVDIFQELVVPLKPISGFITSLTGITNKMVSCEGKPLFKVLNDFICFIENHHVIGHNVRFDMSFLKYYTYNVVGHTITNNCIDTLSLARKLYKDTVNYKLGTLVAKFNIVNENAHRALSDASATYKLYEKIKEDILKNENR